MRVRGGFRVGVRVGFRLRVGVGVRIGVGVRVGIRVGVRVRVTLALSCEKMRANSTAMMPPPTMTTDCGRKES